MLLDDVGYTTVKGFSSPPLFLICQKADNDNMAADLVPLKQILEVKVHFNQKYSSEKTQGQGSRQPCLSWPNTSVTGRNLAG